MDKDRCLLFSLLVVQLKGLDASSIIEAGGPSGIEPGALGKRLVSRQLLEEHEGLLIERLTEEAIRVHDGNSSAALESFGGVPRVTELFGASANASQLEEAVTLPLAYVASGDVFEEACEEAPDRYMQIAQYARGGMGRVLLVHDKHMGRNVALKELLLPDDESQSSIQRSALATRFLQEARVTGQLEHPAIIPVYEMGRRQNGTLYYTMKLVRGQTLLEALRTRTHLVERLELLPHFLDLCQAIAYAHSRQIIHRDIKPANVMIGEFGETVVLDWGLAKAYGAPDVHAEELRMASQSGRSGSRTAFGRALGTPHYMPPEQAEGRVNDIDERSDVYSLGAVLYEILTGRPPFKGATAKETIEKLLSEDLVAVQAIEPEAPPELAGICQKALQKQPVNRYHTARDLADEINRYLSGSLVQSYPYSKKQLLHRFYRRYRASVNTALTALVILLAITGYANLRLLHASQHEREQRIAAEQAMRIADQARTSENEARQLAEQKAYIAQIRLAETSLKTGSFLFCDETLWQTEQARRGWEWGYLLRECNRDLFTIPVAGVPSDKGRLAAFSPDGRFVAARGWKEPIDLVDAQTGQRLFSIGDGSSMFLTMAFSPDSKKLITTSWGDTAQIWDLDGGQELKTLKSSTPRFVTRGCFSPDSRRVALGEQDATLGLWDVDSGKRLATLQTKANVKLISFLPSGELLTEQADQSVCVWSKDNSIRLTVPGTCAAIVPVRNFVAVAQGPQVKVYDTVSGSQQWSLSGLEGDIICLAPDAMGRWIAGMTSSGTVRIWSLFDGQTSEICRVSSPISIEFTPDGSTLLVTSAESVDLWDVASSQMLTSLKGHSAEIFQTQLSSDGTKIVSTSADGTAKIWNVKSELSDDVLLSHCTKARVVDFPPDYTQLATIGQDNDLNVIDRNTGTCRIFSTHCWFGGLDVSFDAQGKRVAAIQDAFLPVVLNLSDGSVASTLRGHTGLVMSIAFSPDGEHIVTGSHDKTARIWNAGTGEQEHILQGHSDKVWCVNYSPDGRYMVTASSDATACIWDAATGAQVNQLTGHSGEVSYASYNSTGELIATASADKTVRIWNAHTGQLVQVLSGHSMAVRSAEFSPDTSRLVTVSYDKTLKIWDPVSGEQFLTLDLFNDGILSARFSPDGRSIYCAERDGRIRVLEAFPFHAEDLSGSAEESWEQRISKQKIARPAPLKVVPREVFVLAAKEMAHKRLGNLLARLQQEDLSVSFDGGLPFNQAPFQSILGQLCLRQSDLLISINGQSIVDCESARAAVANALAVLENQEEPELSMQICRDRRILPVVFRFIPVLTTQERHTLSREDFGQLIQIGAQMFDSLPESLMELAQEHAREIGDVIDKPHGLHGVWITGDNLSMGLTAYDKITSINNCPLLDLDGPRRESERLVKALGAGEAVSLRLELERGMYQIIQMTVDLE